MRKLVLTAILTAASTSAFAATKVCNVRDYGAKGDGVTKDTAAIQKAIDVCSEAHGTVKLAGGTFVSAPLVLKSNLTLDIAPGATLLASPDHTDYPKKTEFRAPGYQAFLTSLNAENITLTGGGIIDGNGKSWWDAVRGTKDAGLLGSENTRPRGLVLDHSRHIKLENITVQNSAYWQIVPYYSDDILIRDVHVFADPHSPNTDAIDPFSSTNLVIERVTADVGDDDIAIKSGMIDSPGPDAPTKNVVIRDCTFLHGHGLSIGSEIAGGAQNILAERIHFQGTDNGLRIKANRDRGADVSSIVFRDITMEDVKTAILVSEYYPAVFPEGEVKSAPIGRLTPIFHNILMENVKATGSKNAGYIVGLPEAPVKDIVLKNVEMTAENGLKVAYAQAIFANVQIHASKLPGIAVAPTAKVMEAKAK